MGGLMKMLRLKFRFEFPQDKDPKGIQDWVVGKKSLLLPPWHWCATSTAGSRPGGLQALGSPKALCKPSIMTPSDTAVRQPYELTPISTPWVAKRNDFCNHAGCEVHSCSILLALLTLKKAEYGWWDLLMHNKAGWKFVTKYWGDLQSSFELCNKEPLVTIVHSLFLAGQRESWIPEEQGQQQNHQTHQTCLSENSPGAKTGTLAFATADHYSTDFLHQFFDCAGNKQINRNVEISISKDRWINI